MLIPVMMVFTEEKSAHLKRTRRRKPKKIVLVGVFIVLLGGTWWILQPRSKAPTSEGGNGTIQGATTLSGVVTGIDGRAITTATILVADTRGNLVNSLAVDQTGHYQLFLPDGTYIFSINAKDQQLIRQVVINAVTPKTIDFELNAPGD